MKHQILFFLLLYVAPLNAQVVVSGSSTESRGYYMAAQKFIKQDDADKAIGAYTAALILEPNNYVYLRDLAKLYLTIGNTTQAITFITKAMALKNNDESVYEYANIIYCKMNKYEYAKNALNKGLKRFPKSGLLYHSKGDLFFLYEHDGDALSYFEKGIEVDPSYHLNYYKAAKLEITQNENVTKALIYAETFINLESFTTKTQEMKKLMLDCYKNLNEKLNNNFGNKPHNKMTLSNTSNEFEKSINQVYIDNKYMLVGGISTNNLIMLRIRFLMDWATKNSKNYNYELFNFQQKLISDGYYEAYNQWVFGALLDRAKFQKWATENATELNKLTDYIQNNKIKPRDGQYYFK
jgi:tetratricopeptide (TPR) repeat protein